MPQAFPPDSQMFAADQRVVQLLELWDTPFSPLRNDQASGGIQVTVREPDGINPWQDWVDNFVGSAVGSSDDTFLAAGARTVIDEGRTANLIGYWAGGAPGYHGASVARRVAYRFEGWVRTPSGRDWFDSATTFTATVACAGHGYFRVVKNGTDLVIDTSLTEKGYLQREDGGPFLSAPISLTTDDKLEFYYVQNDTSWGGFVFKMIPGTVDDSQRARLLAMREGAVVGCGLIDDHLSASAVDVTKRSTTMVQSMEITTALGQTSSAAIKVPLANTTTWDGVGWEWVREMGDEAGFLRHHGFVEGTGDTMDPLTFDIKRQRLIRIKAGFIRPNETEELYTVFTGFVDDFGDASTGVVTIRCLGISQRLVDQFVKNFPDKISYMAYGYQRLSGTSEPVYEVAAYDNWPMEYMLRDLLIRAGIDESRTRAPLFVPQADGSRVAVVM